jgi:dihydropteroate synthase
LELWAREHRLRFDRTLIVGVLNVTPDSFSDGGRFADVAAAVAHGIAMWQAGAGLVDVGGESTRPGAAAVALEEELARVLPVVEQLAQRAIPVSIDTRKPAVARAALAAGACVVNDVSGLDDTMLELLAHSGAVGIAMHMQGTPETMQQRPRYLDVVAEVRDALALRLAAAQLAGVGILLDPGIGFGKTLAHNVALLANLEAVARLGAPVLVGVSRKSFLSALSGVEVDQRLPPTVAAGVAAVLHGAHALRVHDVAAAVSSARIAEALRDAPRTAGATSVRLEGLRCEARIGVGELERAQPQPLLAQVELEVMADAAVSQDLLSATVDYTEVAELVRALAGERERQLLEHLAGAIGSAVLARWSQVRQARVRIAKPRVAEAMGANAVSVEVVRRR